MYIALQGANCYDFNMNTRVWVHKARSFEAAQKFERSYYQGLTGDERVETMQFLRERHFESTGFLDRENRKRLRRVLRVVKQA